MIELTKHIKTLLLQHDCVIIPGLGGFITQYVPAQRVDDKMLFLPPHRCIGFNQQLTINDGLLVQSYMQAYDTSYPETIKLIDIAVNQLKYILENEGEYEFEGIGTLSLGLNGNYGFIPCETGVLTPDLYGLDSLNIPTLTKNSQPASEETEKNKRLHIKRTERSYTISINREFVNYAAAVIVAVFFYFLWATPIKNSYPSDQQAASLLYEQLFTMPGTTSIEPALENQSFVKKTQDLKPTQEETHKNAVQNNKSTDSKNSAQAHTPTYTLVLASAISPENAKSFTKKLQQKGFNQTNTYIKNNMVRVVYGSYPTKDKAKKALQQLKKHSGISDAWILKTE